MDERVGQSDTQSKEQTPETTHSEEALQVQKDTSSQTKEALRTAFPKPLFKELQEKFGACWSNNPNTPDRIIVERFEARESPDSMKLIDLDNFLKERGVTVDDFSRSSIMKVTVEGNQYEFYNRAISRFETSRYDGTVDHNLGELEKILPKNPKVLYVGPSGDMRIKDKFQDVVYLDITSDMLDPGDIKGDANALPFRANSFDLIFFKDMDDPVINSLQVIKEVKRVLKRGGYMFSTGTFELRGKGITIEDPEETLRKKQERVKKIYSDEGFTLIENENFQEPDRIAIMQKG